MAGNSNVAASATSASDWITRYGPTGTPMSVRNAFSAMRSWQVAIAAGDGRTSVPSARRAKAAAGGFSNSVVITAQVAAIVASASGSS